MKRAISVLIVFSVLLGVLPCIALAAVTDIDAYAAFKGLHKLTGDAKYQVAADSALRFINSMFDAEKGLFYTGTTDDGRTQSRDNIVLDAQVWAALGGTATSRTSPPWPGL